MIRWLVLASITACGGRLPDTSDGGGDGGIATSNDGSLSDALAVDAGSDGATGWPLGFGMPVVVPIDLTFFASVQAADVTHDGRSDVLVSGTRIVANKQESGIYVYAQLANGTLAAPVWYLTGSSGSGLVTGDVTGDSKSDAVLEAPNEDGLMILPQDGQGGFAAPLVAAGPDGGAGGDRIVLGRFTQSMNLAAAQGVASMTKPLWLWLESNGTLAWAGQWSGAQFDRAAGGDVNGDGFDDVVVSYLGKGSIGVWIQGGTGDFAPAQEHVYAMPMFGDPTADDVVVGDVTGDGLADIVVPFGGNAPDAHLAVFAQTKTGQLGAAIVYPTLDLPSTARIADMNGDGRNDIVLCHAGFDKLGVYTQLPNGSLSSEQLFSYKNRGVNRGKDIAVADLDGNGRPDVVGIDYASPALLILLAK